MRFLLAGLLLTVCLAFALNLELSVKECAGVGSQGFPITSIVPLPRGQFQDITALRLTDGSGNTVPAQFDILNRRWMDDNSIANLAISFQPTVSAFTAAGTGISPYFLKDDGSGNATRTGLQLTDGSGEITIVTGPLKFTIPKTGFTILGSVWLDKNNDHSFTSDEAVISPDSHHGGRFLGRLAGDLQYDADRSDLKVDIEKTGPMMAVVRVEAVSQYYSTRNQVHGWAVRIYAFAGKPYIKIDYQLQNSTKNKPLGWPLYFHALDLNFKLNLSGNPTVRFGLGNGLVYQRSRGTGLGIAQEKDSLTKIFGTLPTDSLAGAGRADGFIDIDDGTLGVTAMTRYFWQLWPNGFAIDSTNKLSIQLWPEWSSQWRGKYTTPQFSPDGWYWLFDMEHAYKEVLLDFHASGVDNQTLVNTSKTFVFHPVTTYSTAWAGTAKAGLDMEGMVPYSAKISTTDKRIPAYPDKTQFGWAYFSLIGRRDNTAAAGSWPLGQGKFYITENPEDYYLDEWAVIGDLNARGHSMAQYQYVRDSALQLGLNKPFSELTWRRGSGIDTAFLANTWIDVTPLDDAHGWYYLLQDCYYATGNPWQKDWYDFIGEYRKLFLYRANDLANLHTRVIAHCLAGAIQACRANGDSVIPQKMMSALVNNFKPTMRRQFGDRTSGDQAMEAGYLCRDLINLMDLSSNPQLRADCFQILSAYMNWNLKYANFYSTKAPLVTHSDVGGVTFMDDQAWYYFNTGKKEYRDHLLLYLDSGILGGRGPDLGKKWDGAFVNRWVQYFREKTRSDSIPPVAISDLKLKRTGKTCTLTWTGPENAVRYHVVWGDRPIADPATEDPNYLNWWAANAIGPAFKPSPGKGETLSFTLPDTGYALVFAGVFSFDSMNNMSVISNLGVSDSTLPTAPANLQATVVGEHQVNLSWQPSSDPESGIRGYAVYCNDQRVETVSGVAFSCMNLSEKTTYTFDVAAISGSLVEGTPSRIQATTALDANPPRIISVTAISRNPEIIVHFDETVEKSVAENAANYSLDSGKVITRVVLQPDSRSVSLTCTPLMPGASYALTVSHIMDVASTPNALTAPIRTTFGYKLPFEITKTFRFDKADPYNFNDLNYFWDTADTGKRCYLDEDFRIKDLPKAYRGFPMLKTYNSKTDPGWTTDSTAGFTTNKEIIVFVAYDDSQRAAGKAPAWLTSRFTDSGDDLTLLTPAGRVYTFSLYARTFPAGAVVLGGNSGVSKFSMYFAMVFPTDSSITGNPVDVERNAIESAAEFMDAYPNPFNPQLRVVLQCRLPALSGNVACLEIFTLQGRKVASLSPLSILKSGGLTRMEYSWNASHQGSGVFVLRSRSGNRLWQKKVLLIK